MNPDQLRRAADEAHALMARIRREREEANRRVQPAVDRLRRAVRGR